MPRLCPFEQLKKWTSMDVCHICARRLFEGERERVNHIIKFRMPWKASGLFPLGLRFDSQASPHTKCCELDVNSASYFWRVVDSESPTLCRVITLTKVIPDSQHFVRRDACESTLSPSGNRPLAGQAMLTPTAAATRIRNTNISAHS